MLRSRPTPTRPGPGQESVWDYPRPPRIEDVPHRVQIEFNGVVVADTTRAKRVLETASPPTFYLPPDDVRLDLLRPAAGHSYCEWKGPAEYRDLVVGDRVSASAAWLYPSPLPAFASIAGYIAFYAGRVDAARVGDERVRPQPGRFYGGWVTDTIVGPFKGEPGSEGW